MLLRTLRRQVSRTAALARRALGDLLNLEGEWREELSIETLRAAFPDRDRKWN